MAIAAIVPRTVEIREDITPTRRLFRAASSSSPDSTSASYQRIVNPSRGKRKVSESLKENRIRRKMGR
jgi:hypothetical protein